MTRKAQGGVARDGLRGVRAASGGGGLDEVLARLQEETQLWQGFLSVHRQVVDALADQLMRDHQLPLEWFDVLVHLADVPGMRLRQRVLRDRLLLSESGVSRLLVRMERAGLISRTPADDDGRGIDIELTECGQEALSAAVESHLQLVAELFTDRLTATDRVALLSIVSKLAGHMPESRGD